MGLWLMQLCTLKLRWDIAIDGCLDMMYIGVLLETRICVEGVKAKGIHLHLSTLRLERCRFPPS